MDTKWYSPSPASDWLDWHPPTGDGEQALVQLSLGWFSQSQHHPSTACHALFAHEGLHRPPARLTLIAENAQGNHVVAPLNLPGGELERDAGLVAIALLDACPREMPDRTMPSPSACVAVDASGEAWGFVINDVLMTWRWLHRCLRVRSVSGGARLWDIRHQLNMADGIQHTTCEAIERRLP